MPVLSPHFSFRRSRGVLVAAALLTLAGVRAEAQLAHRQTDVTVKVRNGNGAALPGATIRVEMVNPAFRFGDAVLIGEITPGSSSYSANTVKYLQQYFNSVTLGNELKWTEFESRPVATTISYIQRAMALKAFNSADGFRFRGHATIWGAQVFVPADVRAMTDPAAIRTRILSHVSEYHAALKGLGIDCFDLYNEPFHERTYIMAKLAPGTPTAAEEAVEIAPWYKKAKEADPTAQLFINEYNMLNFWQENDADIIKYKQLIDAVRDAGGEIGGIGLQGHMDRYITKAQVARRLNLLAAPMAPTLAHPTGLPGLPIEITELDVNNQVWTSATPQQQAEVVANVLDAAFENPSVQGVTMWGINDSTHWRKNAVMFDDSDRTNWKIKPSGQAWIDRVKGTWWTNVSGSTGASGTFATPVFKGRHRIVVEYLGQTQEFIRDLTTPNELVVTFAGEPIDTTQSRLSNLSVRTRLAAKQEVTIGFVARGGAVPVLVRAAGPGLSQWLSGVMPDPHLTIYNQASQVVGSNDNWDASLADIFPTVGAFPFQPASKDSATQFSSDSNTVIVSGNEGGAVLVEAYDRSSAPNARLVNVSARNLVGTGDDILIAGFNVGGSGYKRLLIRAVGPKLASFGVPDVLADPKVELYRMDNGQNVLVQSNDNWTVAPSTFKEAGAFDLDAGSKDAAMIVVLAAGGSYTAQVSGVNNTTGAALVEVYELP